MAKNKIIPFLGIRGLIGIMLLALITLLGVQWYWVRNAVALKEAEFERKVNNSLIQVVERLQEQEIENHMLRRARTDQFVSEFIYQFASNDSSAHAQMQVIRQDIIGPPRRQQEVSVILQRTGSDSTKAGTIRQVHVGQQSSSQSHQTKEIEEIIVVQGDTVQQRRQLGPQHEAYVQRVMTQVLMRSAPIERRIRLGQIDSLIRRELHQHDIEDRFEFDIISEPILLQALGPYRSRGQGVAMHHAKKLPGTSQEGFSVQMFPHDLRPSEDHLLVQFPDRRNTTLQAMGLLLPTSGVLVLVVLLCFGLTLYALQRQQKLSELKTDFINNMTHELKTPISTISLALQALHDPDMQKAGMVDRYARIIGEENQRLQAHVERVLQAAASEDGTLQLRFAEVDVHALLQDEIAQLRLHVAQRGGQVNFQPNATQPLLSADPVHLAGILRNLLDNANKYSPERPHISIATRNAEGGIFITIRDQGKGMSRETQKHIFEKFYRLPQGNVHDVKGFGLGLSYVLALIKAHQGRIRVESELGKGSTFEIFLPQKPILS